MSSNTGNLEEDDERETRNVTSSCFVEGKPRGGRAGGRAALAEFAVGALNFREVRVSMH